ncbi:hypothetical protein PQX77_017388 [Marasmius sp. AFHP31]|nr:hypothetical protein PQX77_022333 [Marasmius sp. AFHP31]KAK1219865.1 hypothetical protein PQX77_017388 [Marasmius sp. AFHP31]
MSRSSSSASPPSTQPRVTNLSPSQLQGNKRGFDEAIDKEGARAKKPRRGGRKRVFTPKTKHEDLESAAKYFKRNVDFNIPFHMVVIEGVQTAGKDEWAAIVEALPPLDLPLPDPPVSEDNASAGKSEVADNEHLAHCQEAWSLLIENQPVVAEFVDYVAESGNIEGFLTLISSMTEEADQMLWNDNATLKKAALDLLEPSTFPYSVHPKPSKKTAKEERGVKKNLILEQFLSWNDIIPYRDDDEAGPLIFEEYRSIVDPKNLCAVDLPALLYNPDMVEEDLPTKGFLFSPFLVRCAQHILTSESSVGQDPANGKTPATMKKREHTDNAGKMNMYKVPIRFIAYVATLARFALSTVPRWGSDDNTFDFTQFYYLIIKMFSKMLPSDQEVILKFWNLSIFGNAKGRIRRSNPSASVTEGSNADLFMQHCEEAATAAAAAATVIAAAAVPGHDVNGNDDGPDATAAGAGDA